MQRALSGLALSALLLSAAALLTACRDEQTQVTKHPAHSAKPQGSTPSYKLRVASHVPNAASAVPASSAAPPASSAVSAKKPVAAVETTWVWPESPIGEMQVVVVVPKHLEGDRLPVLITMHGLGESRKGPEKGARGWLDDYALGSALERLQAPPITPGDLRGFAGDRVGLINAALSKQPYQGLILVMPYTPDILKGDRPFSLAEPLANFLVDTLLPRVYKETPAIGTPATTGVDGVSLGGRAALLVGLTRPEAFGAVGGLQPAFDQKDAPEFTRRTLAARKLNPKLQLRLLTSVGDYYLGSTKAISSALEGAQVEHSLLIVPGDHSYKFNRGPGAYELLLYHDRVLHGLPPI